MFVEGNGGTKCGNNILVSRESEQVRVGTDHLRHIFPILGSQYISQIPLSKLDEIGSEREAQFLLCLAELTPFLADFLPALHLSFLAVLPS